MIKWGLLQLHFIPGKLQCFIGWCDWWQFLAFFPSPLAVLCTTQKATKLPATRAVQRGCDIVSCNEICWPPCELYVHVFFFVLFHHVYYFSFMNFVYPYYSGIEVTEPFSYIPLFSQPHSVLINRLFGRRSKKTSKLRVTGLCAGNSPGSVNSPHKGPVTWKMCPFDDVIMNVVDLMPMKYHICKEPILLWVPAYVQKCNKDGYQTRKHGTQHARTQHAWFWECMTTQFYLCDLATTLGIYENSSKHNTIYALYIIPWVPSQYQNFASIIKKSFGIKVNLYIKTNQVLKVCVYLFFVLLQVYPFLCCWTIAPKSRFVKAAQLV